MSAEIIFSLGFNVPAFMVVAPLV